MKTTYLNFCITYFILLTSSVALFAQDRTTGSNSRLPAGAIELQVVDGRADLKRQQAKLTRNKTQIQKSSIRILRKKEKSLLEGSLDRVEVSMKKIHSGEINKTKAEVVDITNKVEKLNRYLNLVMTKNRLLTADDEDKLVEYLGAVERSLGIAYNLPPINQEVISCINAPRTTTANPFHVVIKNPNGNIINERDYFYPTPTTMRFGLQPGTWFIEVSDGVTTWIFEVEIKFWYWGGIFERYEGKIVSARIWAGERSIAQDLIANKFSCGFDR